MNQPSQNGRFVTNEDEVEQLRFRLAEARQSLRHDADELVDSAQQLGDWREYVRRFPAASMAVAAAIGFAVVPSRPVVHSPDVKTLTALARRNRLLVKPDPRATANRGLLSTLFTLAATTAVRGAVAYATNQLATPPEGGSHSPRSTKN